MSRQPIRAAVLAVTAAILVSSCSGGPEATPAKTAASPVETMNSTVATPTPATDLPSGDDLDDFFQALATGDPDLISDVVDLSEEGSPARGMANYYIESGTADVDQGIFEPGEAATATDDGYETCSDPADDSTCVTWGNIEGRAGKIVSFTISDEPISDHLTIGTGRAQRVGSLGSIEFLTSYKTVTSNSVLVVGRVKSGDKQINVGTFEATYRSPNGRQTTASDAYGPNKITADSTANFYMVFPRAELGGTVTLDVFGDDFMTTETVSLKTA